MKEQVIGSNLEKVNVLFVFHHANLNNGAVRSMVDVIETLQDRFNINPIVVYPWHRGSAVDYLEKIGVHCYHVPYGCWNYPLHGTVKAKLRRLAEECLKYLMSVFSLKKFDEIIRNENIQLIYSNTAVIYTGAVLARRHSLPHIWHIREFLKEDHDFGIYFGEEKLYSRLKEADALIYISKSIQKKYSRFVSDDVIQETIYNDISPQFISEKESFNTNPEQPLEIAIIGAIQKGKGQHQAIEAIELLKKRGVNVHLHIAGNPRGAYYEQLVEYVHRKSLEDQVSFDGFITDVNGYRKNMDVGIVASSNEAFGRVTVEGMLSMMAMIGAKAAGTSELIEHGKTGYLFELGNVEELADQIEHVNNDRSEMVRIANAGFAYAKDNFTKGTAAQKISRVIRRVIGRR